MNELIINNEWMLIGWNKRYQLAHIWCQHRSISLTGHEEPHCIYCGYPAPKEVAFMYRLINL